MSKNFPWYANRPSDALPAVTTYLAKQPSDREALIAGLYAAYSKHRQGAQPTLASDRTLAQQWLKTLMPTAGPLQPLVTAWVRYLDGLK